MFPVSVYFGGHIEFGPTGASYSKGPNLSFPSDEVLTFPQLKDNIYKRRGLSDSHYTLSIKARYKMADQGGVYFTLIPVRDDCTWSYITQSVVSGSDYRIVELFVDFIPNFSNRLEDVIGVESTSDSEYIQIDESEEELSEEGEIEDLKEEEREKYNSEDSSNDEGDEVEWDSCVPLPVPSNDNNNNMFDYISDDEVGYPFVPTKKFRSKEDLEHTIRKIHILQNRVFVVVSSSRTTYKVKCGNEMCAWNLYARADCCGYYWFIRSCSDPHTCPNDSGNKHKDKLLTDSFVAEEISQAVWRNAAIGIKEISSIIESRYKIVPSAAKLWRAKEMVTELEFGSWTEAYALLPALLQAIQAKNPGTKFEIESDGTEKFGVRVFRRAVWAFGPAIKGFRYLRPVIGVDSVRLSGKFKGKLILACGFDAEFELFPVAFAVVDKEDDNSNWAWFMKWLRREVVGPDRTVCVISDHQEPLICDVFRRNDCGWCEDKGEAVHRYCSRHISESIDSQFKDARLVAAFDRTVKQKERHKFDEGMKKIENMSREAYGWLREIGRGTQNGPEKENRFDSWAQCEDSGFRWGIMSTNGSEDLKKVFAEIPYVPINGIAEKTFYITVERFANRREHARILAAETESTWASHVREKLEKRQQKAEMYEIKTIDLAEGKYEASLKKEKVIQGESSTDASKKYSVTLFGDKVAVCTCQKPTLTGIPCAHVLALCGCNKFQRDDFVSHFYTAEALLNTWSPQFNFLGNRDEWPRYEGPVIVLDETRVNRGRMEEFTRPMVMDELQ